MTVSVDAARTKNADRQPEPNLRYFAHDFKRDAGLGPTKYSAGPRPIITPFKRYGAGPVPRPSQQRSESIQIRSLAQHPLIHRIH